MIGTPARAQTNDAERPNIVYVLADDLGYGEIQSYNPTRGKVPTPNVNRLAREGMMFTDAHSASAVCTPTRYALLTGRYAWRTELQRGVVGPGGHEPLIEDDRMTVGHLLQEQGYATACIGKWHLGFRYSKKGEDAGKRDPGPMGARILGGPTTRGFDSFYGFPLSRTMSTVIENDKVVEKLEPVEMLPRLAERSAEYIQSRAKQDKPFFLYLALNSPHTPLAVNDRFAGQSGLSRHSDYVMETDWAVGEVLDAKLPDSAGVDSVSILPLLKGGEKPVRQSVIHRSIRGHFALRQGNWKLLLCPGSGGWTAPKGNQARKRELPPVQLYNMNYNTPEQNNQQSAHPERVRRMVETLRGDVRRGRTTPGPPQENEVEVDLWKGAKRAKKKCGED